MGKCLNCGKEVGNKYCNVTCQNEHRGKVNKEKYYLNPKLCLNCGEIIPYESKVNKFCSHSCAAIKNNQGIVRNLEGKTNSILNQVSDENFIKYVSLSKSWNDLGYKLGYKSTLATNIKERILEKAKRLEIIIDFSKELIKNNNKGKIFELSKNWQTARTAIRKDACKVFEKSNKEYKCAICGYNKHVEIAHIKAVSEFSDSSTLEEINHIDNLVGLCPTHHWEYDAGLIDL